jgi:hypothetical protein
MLKSRESPVNELNSYYLTDAYNSEDSQCQFKFIFAKENGCIDLDTDAIYKSRLDALTKLLQEENQNANQIIYLLSLISLKEDECYHTQGAFFHAVMMLQRKIEFKFDTNNTDQKNLLANLLRASYIENIKFAISHKEGHFLKYVERINDASARLKTLDASYESKFPLRQITYIESTEKKKASNEEAIYNQLKSDLTKFKKEFAGLNESDFPKFQELKEIQGVRSQSHLRVLRDPSNNPIKKHIQHRDRIIYVDARRVQYVKYHHQYVPIRDIRRQSTSQSVSKL